MSATTVPCPVCGEAHTPLPFELRNESVCSPCRAEHTGSVQLRLPLAVAPDEVALRLDAYKGDPDFAGAVQAGLQVWARALQDGADTARAALAALENRPDEERVAEEFMGAPLVTGCEFVADTDGRRPGLSLTGLPPGLARRIVETVPMAGGPPLSGDEVARLLGGRRG